MSERIISNYLDKHIRADVTALIAAACADFVNYKYALQAANLSLPFLDYEAAAREAGWYEKRSDKDGAGIWWHDAHQYEFDIPEECCEKNGLTPHEIPIIGHYIVTSGLAGKLEARGERVERDFGGLIIWARKAADAEACARDNGWDGTGSVDAFCEEIGLNPDLLDRDPVLLAIIAEPYEDFERMRFEKIEAEGH